MQFDWLVTKLVDILFFLKSRIYGETYLSCAIYQTTIISFVDKSLFITIQSLYYVTPC
jgi:hypothetical protein